MTLKIPLYILLFSLAFATGLAGAGPVNAHDDDLDDVEHLMQLDRDFSDLSRRMGPAAAWAATMGDFAVQLNEGAQPIVGLVNILATFRDWPEGATLTWAPEGGGISASRDLGFTWGRWLFEGPGENGAMVKRYGKYISIWKKQPDGTWKIIVDGGNGNPPPPQ